LYNWGVAHNTTYPPVAHHDGMTDSASPSILRLPRLSFERFAFLDALRGLGALGVACYHIHRYRPLQGPVDKLLPAPLQAVLLHGWMGVPVFFVIAGFVAACSLRHVTVTPGFFGNFTLRRVIRLGIPYWVTLLLIVLLDLVTQNWLHVDSLTDPIEWPTFLANLVFLQDVLDYGNITAGTWFVCIDLQLGILFVLMLWLAQRLGYGYADSKGVQAAMLTAVFAPVGLLSLFIFNLDAQFDMWVLYFFCIPLLGAMAWWALDGRIPAKIFWAYALAMLVGLVYQWRLEVAIGLAAGVTIYLVGRLGHLGDWLSARWLQYLGRISYSLFLIHYPVGWIVVVLGHWFTGDRAVLAIFWLIAALAASIGAAHLMYNFVELPSIRLARWLKTDGAVVTVPRPEPTG
jgi:peptidoglycan/LPS O-acetylase OafA/YrhL